MTRTRRRFLAQFAGGAALSAAAPSLAYAGSTTQGPTQPPGTGRYDYLGRTSDYRDWAVVPRGLTGTGGAPGARIGSKATFSRGASRCSRMRRTSSVSAVITVR